MTITRHAMGWLAAVATATMLSGTGPIGNGALATLTLQPREHIAIVGNTLAERMQYDGWLETMIHARFPKHELVVRNLGFSGDEIETRFRSKNFGAPDEWLSAQPAPIGGYQENRFEGINTRPDVIFAFFGYNESYAGAAGLETFKKQLGNWIAHTLSQRYNGTTPPRLVVFSPIAHEDLGNPDLPNGRENNERLALYTKAMAEVAQSHNVFFVDLFAPSQALYASQASPLTMQGIHLTSEGNRLIAGVIDRTLFGNAPQYDMGHLNALRQAVRDKDFHWFQRYRVPNGYSTYGDRAFLKFVRGNPRNVNDKQLAAAPPEDVLPTNYDVLQRELPVLDVMTRNRDRRIWAVARGADLAVDDSEAPSFVDAKTNLTKTQPFISGEEGIERMTVGPGLKVELFASETEFPELVNPVQMAFDTRGRLWVASWKNYPALAAEDADGRQAADPRGHQRRREGRQAHGLCG